VEGRLACSLSQISEGIEELIAGFAKLDLEMNEIAQEYQIGVTTMQISYEPLV
jgi:hypothetical protein